MTILTPGINGFEPQERVDPRHEEVKLNEGERLTLAQERARQLNVFSNMEDAMKFHSQNIAHLMTEEKYESFLPVMLSSTVAGQIPWAPYSDVVISDGCRDLVYNKEGYYNDILQGISNQIEDGLLLSTMRRQEYDNHALTTTPVFNFVPRAMVEYNPKFVQLCVVVIVRKGDKFLLLRTPDVPKARIRNSLTFIQGHVEIDPDVNDMSALEYLTREAVREINEEVQGLDEYTKILDYKGLFHDNRDPVSQEHISAIFVVDINPDDKLEIETNEADKHTARFYTLDEIKEDGNPDGIVKYFLDL